MLTEGQMIEQLFSGGDVLRFDMMENDEGETVALCIGQWENEKPLQVYDPDCILINGFAETHRLPFFLIRCAMDDSWRHIRPVNTKAREIVPEPTTLATSDWLAFAEKCIEAHA